jgi:hypothetical protein
MDNIKNIISYELRCHYLIIIPILLSLIFQRTELIYLIFNNFDIYTFKTIILILNFFALYIVFFKIKIKFTLCIAYN